MTHSEPENHTEKPKDNVKKSNKPISTLEIKSNPDYDNIKWLTGC